MMKDHPPSMVNSRVIISESYLREVLLKSCSHIKCWTQQEKLMCGCEICTLFEEIHKFLLCFPNRRQQDGRLLLVAWTMETRRRQGVTSWKLTSKKYARMIMVRNPGMQVLEMRQRIWDASGSLLVTKITHTFHVCLINVTNVRINGTISSSSLR